MEMHYTILRRLQNSGVAGAWYLAKRLNAARCNGNYDHSNLHVSSDEKRWKNTTNANGPSTFLFPHHTTSVILASLSAAFSRLQHRFVDTCHNTDTSPDEHPR